MLCCPRRWPAHAATEGTGWRQGRQGDHRRLQGGLPIKAGTVRRHHVARQGHPPGPKCHRRVRAFARKLEVAGEKGEPIARPTQVAAKTAARLKLVTHASVRAAASDQGDPPDTMKAPAWCPIGAVPRGGEENPLKKKEDICRPIPSARRSSPRRPGQRRYRGLRARTMRPAAAPCG